MNKPDYFLLVRLSGKILKIYRKNSQNKSVRWISFIGSILFGHSDESEKKVGSIGGSNFDDDDPTLMIITTLLWSW